MMLKCLYSHIMFLAKFNQIVYGCDPNHGFFFHFSSVALSGELPKEYLPCTHSPKIVQRIHIWQDIGLNLRPTSIGVDFLIKYLIIFLQIFQQHFKKKKRNLWQHILVLPFFSIKLWKLVGFKNVHPNSSLGFMLYLY